MESPPSSQLELEDLPVKVVVNILEKADYQSLCNVKKVNSTLRNITRDLAPPKFDDIFISCGKDQIRVKMTPFGSNNMDDVVKWKATNHIIYANRQGGCSVHEVKHEVIRDLPMNCLDALCADMEIPLGKTETLEELNLVDETYEGHQFIVQIGGLLARRDYRINVKNFKITAFGAHYIMEVLPHLDPNHLAIFCIRGSYANLPTVQLDRIVNTEQWQSLESVRLDGCFMPTHWNRFEHLKFIDISTTFLTADQMTGLKDLCLINEIVEEVHCMDITFPMPIRQLPLFTDRNFLDIEIGRSVDRHFFFSNPETRRYIVGITHEGRNVKIQKWRGKHIPELAFYMAGFERVPLEE